MTDANETQPPTDTTDTKPKGRARRRRRWLFASGAGLLAAVAGVYATRAFASPGGFGRFGRVESADELRERIGNRLDFALWKIDATDAQRARVDEILDRAAPQLFSTMQKGHDVRRALMEALASGDHSAAELNRKQALTWADEASKLWLSTFEQAMGVLNADQRAKVREHMQHFAGRHHHGGRHE
jgi:Spy/CpxP family protein refolding chaperone